MSHLFYSTSSNNRCDFGGPAFPKYSFVFLLIFVSLHLKAQWTCGASSAAPPQNNASSSGPCYDMDYIQDNCTTVFVKVNVHFFLDNDCEGELASSADLNPFVVPTPENHSGRDILEFGDFNRHNAFDLAEKLVDDANHFIHTMNLNETNENHQWNQAAHGAVVTPHQCAPMQFVLKGTRIHCDSDAQVNSANNEGLSDFTEFVINNDTEINVLMTKIVDAGGYTTLQGDKFVTQFVDHWAAPSVFLHEIFHDFNLGHTFATDDGCDDTFRNNWTFDGNGDGVIDMTPGSQERGLGCWNRSAGYNEMDACDENLFPMTHYCCEWENQSNNLMNYSQYGSYIHSAALTPCQVTRALDHINDAKCDFIADVGSCPPPSAFIGRLPEYDGASDCKSCFYLNASYNESGYEVIIKDAAGFSVIETGYIDNLAGKYCITARLDKFGIPEWPYGMVSGQLYTLKLHVQNECGDFDDHEVQFELPSAAGCYAQNPEEIKNLELITIAPNPATDIVTVDFNLKDMGTMKIYGKYITAMNIYNNPKIEEKSIGDGQQMTFDVSNWSTGINSVIFQFKDEIYIENIVKE